MAAPPPRKSKSAKGPPGRKPPPRKSKKGKSAAKADALAATLAAIEANTSGPAQRSDDPLQQEWVFKDGDILKGPVKGEIVASHARDGTLGKDCPVGHEVGEWRPLKSVPAFYKALKEGKAERDRDQRRRAYEARASRNAKLRVVVVMALMIMPFAASAMGARAVMVARPWDDTQAWIEKAPPIVDLPERKVRAKPKAKPAPEPDPAPTDGEKVAMANPDHLPLAPISKKADKRRGKKGKRGRDKGKKGKDKAKAKKGKDDKAKETKVAAAAKKNLPRTLTNKQITGGLAKAKRGIGGCLKAEFKRNKNMPKTVTMGFVVANDGKAIQVKVLERQVRNGPLPGCLRKALSRVKWPEFYGERKYTEIPFKISK